MACQLAINAVISSAIRCSHHMTVILKLFNMKLSISSLTFGILKLIFGPRNEMLTVKLDAFL